MLGEKAGAQWGREVWQNQMERLRGTLGFFFLIPQVGQYE